MEDVRSGGSEKKISTMSIDLWQAGCERLAAEMPEQQFNTWIRPLPAAQVLTDGPDGTVISVNVPNRFKLDWIRSQYASRIETLLTEVAGKPVRLELILALRDMPGRPVNAFAGVRPANQPAHAMQAMDALAGLPGRRGGDDGDTTLA